MSADKQRFDRCLTPMGTVPISVIYGFHYPVNKRSRTPPTANPSDSVPRRGAATSRPAAPAWPSSLASSRTEVLNVRIISNVYLIFALFRLEMIEWWNLLNQVTIQQLHQEISEYLHQLSKMLVILLRSSILQNKLRQIRKMHQFWTIHILLTEAILLHGEVLSGMIWW